MNPRPETPGSEPDDELQDVFESFVRQQENLALLLLGEIPPPDGGKPLCDLESARSLIAQLEMFEHKTRGNLTEGEAEFLGRRIRRLQETFGNAMETQTREA